MGTLSCALSVPGVASVGSGDSVMSSMGRGLSVMRSKCAWRGLSWKWFDQSAMGTLSCALSVPGVESVGSGLIRAQWGLCHAL